MRIKGTIFMLFIILLFINGCFDSRPKDAKTCVHLVSVDNERYSLVYYGERCPQQDFIPLPGKKYDQVFSWAFNTSGAGIISHLDRFMIISRLATLEKRSNIHIIGALSGICPLIEHKWHHFADQAYLGLHDGPTRDDVKVAEHLEKPLLEKKFVKPDDFLKYTFISKGFQVLKGLNSVRYSARLRTFSPPM